MVLWGSRGDSRLPSRRLHPPLPSVDRSQGTVVRWQRLWLSQDKSPGAAILSLSQDPWGKRGQASPVPPTARSPGAPHSRARTPWRTVAAPPRLQPRAKVGSFREGPRGCESSPTTSPGPPSLVRGSVSQLAAEEKGGRQGALRAVSPQQKRRAGARMPCVSPQDGGLPPCSRVSLQAFVSRSYHQEPILKVPEAQADLSFRNIRLRLLPGSAAHALGWISMKNTQNQAGPSPRYTRLQHVQMVFFSGYPAPQGSTDLAWCLVLCGRHVGLCTPTSERQRGERCW